MNLNRPLHHFLIFGLALLLLPQFVASQISPWLIQYSDSRSFGPDGPWNVISMATGWNPEQYIDFYPADTDPAVFITKQICEKQDLTCPKPLPQLYDKSQSPNQPDNATSHRSIAAKDWDPDRVEALGLTGTGRYIIERVTFHGIPYSNADNTSVLLSQNITSNYPNGLQVPLTVGLFPLGGTKDNETVTNDYGDTTIVKYMLGSSYLKGLVPSRSWGLHIGSAAQNISGSLYWGGYDQSRLIEKPATFRNSTLNLTDISIGTSSGKSPIPAAKLTNLLHSPLNVVPDAGVPYIYLPLDICTAIADQLPVTFNPGLGLYTWNIHDPAFALLTASPSYIQFTFTDLTNTKALVKVPFRLLNLTLEAPLSPTPIPYFPCSPLAPQSNIWRLGRAFLQAAFTAQNWDSKTYYIGQAPGPKFPPPSIKTMLSLDSTITANPFANSWEATWDGILQPLLTDSKSNSSSNTTPNTNTNTTLVPIPPPSTNQSRLSINAQIGLGVGIGAAGVLSALGIYLIWRRKQRRMLESNRADPRDSLSTMHNSPLGKPSKPTEYLSSKPTELYVEPPEMWVSPPEIYAEASAELPIKPAETPDEPS
ncbi:MAG: hypothetical protein M1829_006356 [Trizodia sp. TS-e1964]|nr:MAG: hypothetical protein M1829_006356 [Trizodia sp. TS-e1964]